MISKLATLGEAKGFRHFAGFVAAGSIAALVNLLARYLLDAFMPFEAAVVMAYIAGMGVAFVLFQRVIFRAQDGPAPRRIVRFVQVNLIGMALAALVSTLMARWLLPAAGWTLFPFEFAHFVGVAAPTVSSYFLHRAYTFR